MMVSFYPKLAQWLPNLSGWNYVARLAKVRHDLFDRIIDEHRKTRIEEHPRDYIDVYLNEMEATKDPTSSFHQSTARMIVIIIYIIKQISTHFSKTGNSNKIDLHANFSQSNLYDR